MNLPPEFFENRVEQAKIKEAVGKAIPENVYYHNLIIAFAEMLVQFTQRTFKEEVFNKSTSLPDNAYPVTKENLCETLINMVNGQRLPFAKDAREESYNNGIARAATLIRRYQKSGE